MTKTDWSYLLIGAGVVLTLVAGWLRIGGMHGLAQAIDNLRRRL